MPVFHIRDRPLPERLEDRVNPVGVSLDPTSYAADRVLVTLSNPADPSAVAASPLASGVEALGFGVVQVNLKPGVGVGAAVAALRTTRGVAAAEPDYTIGANLTPNDPRPRPCGGVFAWCRPRTRRSLKQTARPPKSGRPVATAGGGIGTDSVASRLFRTFAHATTAA